MTVSTLSLLEPDRFVESHLGKPVYRLTQPDRAAEALAGLAGPFLVEARIPTEAVAEARRLTMLGFAVIDVGVQLDAPAASIRQRPAPAGPWRIRAATAADRAAVERSAADNLVTSRFHLDPSIDPAAASRLKAAWAGNFFDGRRGERLLVVDCGGRVGGFLQTLERQDVGVIDLVALDPDMRGTGAFAGLIGTWLGEAPSIARAVVGTQASNVRSLRAYGALGFRVCGTSFVLHRHEDGAAGRPA